jgi:hypothetical protein
MIGADTNRPAEPDAEAAEQPWERLRRLRQADLDTANAHGEQLAERYGHTDYRPRFAFVGHKAAKRRRRR